MLTLSRSKRSGVVRSRKAFSSRLLAAVLCLTLVTGIIIAIDMSGKNGRSLAAECTSSPPTTGRTRQKSQYQALDAKQLIPVTPSKLVVCRYQASERSGWQLRLQAHVLVAHRDIPRVMNAMATPLIPGDHGCPMQAAAQQVYLVARFSGAPDLVAWIRDRCGVASNGTLIGAFVSRSANTAILTALHLQ